jgi:putative ABC transport system permease protein
MKELFGIPMSTFATILVVLLVICLLIVVYIALRKPIVFKMGLRGIPRRPAQTVLIVIGLMLSTLIVASALGVGDTLDSSVRTFAYDQLGEIDQIIVTSDRGEADTFTGNYFPESKFGEVQAKLSGISDIDGLLPVIYSSVATINNQTRLANSQVFVTGIDPAQLRPFGGIKSVDGSQIDLSAFPQDTVVVSEALSQDLDLNIGDTFTAYVSGQPTDLTVGAIARNSALLGFGNNPDGTTNSSAFAMALPQAQALLNHPGELNSIFVTMTGGVEQPKSRIEDVNAQAAKLLDGSGLGIYDGKADFLDAAEGISTGFTSIFIVLGLFSIAAGILLIVLIFTMLAAERRPEMGMARAVGQRRLQLIQQFIAEGSGYALAAGVVGAALGIGATFLMAAVLNALLGDSFPIHAKITSTSLISAYALGVFITFVTVVAASWKVSRLNIVAAVRDIPDVQLSKRRKRTLLWGLLLVGLGAGLLLGGTSSDKAFPFYAGISLLPFGIALFARFFGVPSRLAFSLVGLWLVVVWLLPDSLFEKIFGKYDGGIEMFFLSGIFLVIGSTVLIVQNTTTLLRGVTALGGLFKSKLAAVKLAVAYPGQARGRTGMAIAMFSLIIFSLVMIATISQNLTAAFLNDDALGGWNIQANGNSGQPIPDFNSKVAQAVNDPSDVLDIGKVTQPAGLFASMQETGPTSGPKGSYPVYEMDPTFVATTTWKFQYRAKGYDSNQAVIDALKSEPNVVVIDSIPVTGNDFGPPATLDLPGFKLDGSTFEPVDVTIANEDGSGSTVVKVIGVIGNSPSFLQGMFGTQPALDPVIGKNGTETYYINTAKGADTVAMARAIEGAVITSGVRVTSIQKLLEDQQRISRGFLYMIQGFMGLGLIVGLAAVGVIAFRSVVERRQQIGMLRAIGFQKQMVSFVFLLETAYVVVLGIIAGTAMGLILARNLLASDSEDLNVKFQPPYPLIAIILIGTVLVALLMAWVPSRQASNIAPADALRYE